MSDPSDQVKDNIRGLSDEALTKMIVTDYRDYTAEAVAFAKEELSRRGKANAAKGSGTGAYADATGLHSDAAAAGPAEAEANVSTAVGKTKGSRILGGVFLVLAAIIIYAGVLLIATIVVAKQQGMQPHSDAVPAVIFYAALSALCLWAGIKRTLRWERFLGITFLILGALAFVARISLAQLNSARGTALNSANSTITMKAMLITAIVLVVVGAACFLLSMTKPAAAE